jgi:hypothetical protein
VVAKTYAPVPLPPEAAAVPGLVMVIVVVGAVTVTVPCAALLRVTGKNRLVAGS